MKFITLGGTYTSNIWITYLGDKIDGPVDNTENTNGIKDVHVLYDGTFEHAFKKDEFKVKKSELKLLLNIAGYKFLPETFSNISFFQKLELRYSNLKNEIDNNSINTYFVYSTSDLDENYSEEEILNFKESLPEVIRKKLFILTEKENSKYSKFFPTFYLEVSQQEIDDYANGIPLVLKDWNEFVDEQIKKGFFILQKEEKTIEQLLEEDN